MNEYPDAVARLISGQSSDCNFVFPSETVARYRRNQATLGPGPRAVRADRFLSWDSFKESAFHLHLERRPVNAVIRRLFAETLALRNHAEPFLEVLVPKNYAANSGAFAEFIAGILPSLSQLLDAAGPAHGNMGPVFQDYRRLATEYQSFLDQHGLFEPAALRPDRLSVARRTYIFFPETIEDYQTYAPLVEACEDVVVVPTPERSLPQLRVYQTVIEEIRAVLDEVEQAVESGIGMEEILLSLGSPELVRPFLESEARLRELPLQFRGGAPLSNHIGAGIFGRLLEMAEGGYHIPRLSALVRNPAVPWRKRADLEQLLGCMVEHGAEGNAAEVRARLKAAGTHRRSGAAAALRTFEQFLQPLERMRSARNFRTLQAAVMQFGRELLESKQWDEENERVYERALVLLQELGAAEPYLEGGQLGAARVWVSLLRKESYVPRQAAAGIPVYSYRVAAGAAPRLQFIIGATQRNCRLRSDPFSFVREDYKMALGLSAHDCSGAVLQLYAGSGERVCFSASRESFAGAELPEPSFMLAQAAEHAVRDRRRDLYLSEHTNPAGSGPRYPSQQQARERLRVLSAGSRPPGLHRSPLDEALRKAVAPRSDGRVALSATPLQAYRDCPFGFLLQYGLRLQETATERDRESALDTGTLYHYILERLFLRIAEEAGSDGAFRASRLPQYREYLNTAIEQAVGTWAPAMLQLDPASYPAVVLRAGDYLGDLLEREAALLEGCSVRELEKSLRIELDDPPVLLTGRVDRVGEMPDGEFCFFDYKRNNVPRAKELAAVTGPPATLQIPLYDLMLRQEYGRPAVAAYYVGVESVLHEAVFAPAGTKSYLDAEQREAAVDAVRELIQQTVNGIAEGAYRVPENTGCERCEFPGVCRMKFHLRFLET